MATQDALKPRATLRFLQQLIVFVHPTADNQFWCRKAAKIQTVILVRLPE